MTEKVTTIETTLTSFDTQLNHFDQIYHKVLDNAHKEVQEMDAEVSYFNSCMDQHIDTALSRVSQHVTQYQNQISKWTKEQLESFLKEIQNDIFNAVQMLIHIAANGSMKKALSLLRQTSEDFSGLISASHLTRDEAYFAFTLYFYPKIAYSLPVSTFTKKECRYIQAPSMSAVLPKVGLNRHIARSIVNGPLHLGGLQLPDVYADQSLGQLRLFLGHLRRNDNTSRLLSIAISVMQLRIGSGILFLNLPFSKYEGWVEKTWLTSLWKFLHVSKLSVKVPTTIRLPSKQRENDSFLMSEFVYLGFKKSELDLMNQCRLYHQVVTVSDIAQADGITIDPKYMSSHKHLDRISPLQWPAQGRPSSKAWSQWNRALLYLQHKGKLKQPLGQWLTRPHQQWNWLVRITDMVLFHKLPRGWEQYESLVSTRARGTRASAKPWYSRDRGRISRRPEGRLAVVTLIATDPEEELFTIVMSSELPFVGQAQTNEDAEEEECSSEASLPSLPSHVDSFYSLIETSAYFKRLVGPILPPAQADLLEIANQISDSELLVCSDGSFSQYSGTGSHAWVFSTAIGDILLQGAGPIDGIPQLLSSYRPELGGITANLFLLTVIVKIFGIEGGGVTLFCDNKSALENVFDPAPRRGIYPLLAVDYDLLVLAKDLAKALPIKIRPEWVKGHYKGNDRLVQHDLNDLVDTMADRFRKKTPKGYTPTSSPLYHPRHGAVLLRQRSMITSKLKQVVYEQLFQEPLINTICKRFKWSPEEFQKVDWDIFGKTFRTYSKFSQIGIAKFVHGQWNTGAQKVKFKQDDQGLCPCCSRALETTDHVFRCTAETAATFREKELQQLGEFLGEQDLPTPLTRCLLHGIMEWTRGELEAPSFLAPTRGRVAVIDQLATQAYVEQSHLGWDAILRGHLSIGWRKVYHHANRTADEQTVDTLFRRVLRKLLQFSLSIWKHRNEVLHGENLEAAKAVELSLAKAKVAEAYEQYEKGQLALMDRDRYLFTKRSKEERLQGDVDTMMCWLRIVEVAINAQERQRKAQEKHADRFFQPFRVLGKKIKAARELLLLKAKVVEAYGDYEEGKLELSERDRVLFTKQTKEELLLGDEIRLLGWLRRFELALTTSARRRQDNCRQARGFFAPFRELGQQRLLASRGIVQEASESATLTPLAETPQLDRGAASQQYLSKEYEQIEEELSPRMREQYWLRRYRNPPVEGLGGTFLDMESQQDILSSDSFIDRGPFSLQEEEVCLSSADSSYLPSLQHDLSPRFDTDHSGTQSSIDLEGYCEEQARIKEAHIAKICSEIDLIYRKYAVQDTPNDSTGDIERTKQSSRTGTLYETSSVESSDLSSDSSHGSGHDISPEFPETEYHAMLRYLQGRLTCRREADTVSPSRTRKWSNL